jgi:hypothetical protein
VIATQHLIILALDAFASAYAIFFNYQMYKKAVGELHENQGLT